MTKGGPIFVILALVVGVVLGYLYGSSGAGSDNTEISDAVGDAIQENIAAKSNPFSKENEGSGYQNPFADDNFNPFSQ